MATRKTQSETIADFVSVHGQTYDYSAVSYVNSRTKVSIICPIHGTFLQTPNNHKSGMGCPRCAAAAKPQCQPRMNPTLISEFEAVHGSVYDYTDMNYTSYHADITVGCAAHGPFEIKPYNHKAGSGCPECYELQRSDDHDAMKIPPTIWMERFNRVHGDRYNYDLSHIDGAMDKITIVCDAHGQFEQICREHAIGKGCRLCGFDNMATKQRKTQDVVISEFNTVHGTEYDYTDVAYIGSHHPVSITCPTHGAFEITPAHHLSGRGCPKCSMNGTSMGEREVANFVRELGFDITTSDRSLIAPYELDIVIPDKKLAIEYCGLYWHSDAKRHDPNYHKHKTDLCEREHYSLITVFEDEWLHNPEIVKRVLRYKLGLAPRSVGARKLTIRRADPVDAKMLLENYHLQGGASATIHTGAYHEDRLVAVMSFGHPTRQNSAEWELKRFVTDGNSYPGVAQRLFNAFVKQYDPSEIVSFSDRRWFTGDIYPVLGFTRDTTLRPDYSYVLRDKRYHKSGYRKDRIKIKHPEVYDSSLTEREMTSMLGLNRIYDCGKVRWAWIK